MQSEQQQRILGYFIEEAKDHLNTIEQGLLNLQSAIADPEMVNEMFRAAHSIKGGAAMLGVTAIQHTSHRLEDYFKLLKECPNITIDQTLESLLLNVFDILQELLEELQGPFGLTDDKAEEATASLEPTLVELNSHINALVEQAGGLPPDADMPDFAPAPKAQPKAVPTPHVEESALQLVFKSDVPGYLRDMLQLFKQEDNAATRSELQSICNSLIQAGEQFDLIDWCHLARAARGAIASSDNTYRSLAPVVIKDLKQGQDQVVAGRLQEICISDALQAMVPLAATDESVDDLLRDLDEDEADAGLAGLFDTAAGIDVEEDVDFSDLDMLSDAEAESDGDLNWLEAGADADDLDLGSASDGDELDLGLGDESGASSAGELGFDQIDQISGIDDVDGLFGDDKNGPEVGTAELNSLADLFEGESIEFGDAWPDQATSAVDLDQEDSTDIDISEDFSDLLSQDNSSSSDFEVDDDLSGFLNQDIFADQDAKQDATEADLGLSFDDDDSGDDNGSLEFDAADGEMSDLFGDENEADLQDLLALDDEAEEADEPSLDFGDADQADEMSDLFGTDAIADELDIDELNIDELETDATAEESADLGLDGFDNDLEDLSDLELDAADLSDLSEANADESDAAAADLMDDLALADEVDLDLSDTEATFDETTEDASLDDLDLADDSSASDALDDDLGGDLWSDADSGDALSEEQADQAVAAAAAKFAIADPWSEFEDLDSSSTASSAVDDNADDPDAFFDAYEEIDTAAAADVTLQTLANTDTDTHADAAIDELGLDEFDSEADASSLDFEDSDSDLSDLGTEDLGLEDLGTDDLGTDDFGLEDLGTEEDLGTDDFGLEDLGAEEDLGTDDLGADDFGIEDLGTEDDFGTEDLDDSLDLDDLGVEDLSDEGSDDLSGDLDDSLFGTDESTDESDLALDDESVLADLPFESTDELDEVAVDLDAFSLDADALTDTTDAESDDFDLSALADETEEATSDESFDLDFGGELDSELEGSTDLDLDLGDSDLGSELEGSTDLDLDLGDSDLGDSDLGDDNLGEGLEDSLFGEETEGTADLDLDLGDSDLGDDNLGDGLDDALFGEEAESSADLDLGLDDDDLSEGLDDALFGEELAEEIAEDSADFGFSEASDAELDDELDLDLGAEDLPPDLDEDDLGLEDSLDESSLDGELSLDFDADDSAEDELDLGLEDESAVGDLDLDFGDDALAVAEDEAASDDLDLDFGDSSIEASTDEADELDLDLGEMEADESDFDAALDADAMLDLDLEAASDESAATEDSFDLDFGADEEADEATEATDLFGDESLAESGDELSLDFATDEASDLEGLDSDDLGELELDGLESEESSGLDAFDLNASETDDLGLDLEAEDAASDDLDFALDGEDSLELEGFETTDEADDLGFADDLDLAADTAGIETEQADDELSLDFGNDDAGDDDLDLDGLDLAADSTDLNLGLAADESSDATDELSFDLGEAEADEELELGGDLDLDFGDEAADEISDSGAAEDFNLDFETDADADALGSDDLAMDGLDLEGFTDDEADGLEDAATADLDLDLGEDESDDEVAFDDVFNPDSNTDLSLDDQTEADLGLGLMADLDEEALSDDLDLDLSSEEEGSEIDIEADFGDDLADLEGFALADTGAVDNDSMAGLDDLLDETEDAIANEADDDFAELDSLLEDGSEADSDSSDGQIDSMNAGNDFADLEALLDDDTAEDNDGSAADGAADDSGDEFEDLEKLLEDADNTLGGSPTVKGRSRTSSTTGRRMPGRRSSSIGEQSMRVSVKHLDNLNNLVGELVVNRNTLEQDEERLRQFLDNLLYQVQQLSDVGQRMRDLYERSLLENSLLSGRQSGNGSSFKMPQDQSEHATGESFDALEMDRFTGFHTLSQEMIELIVRVREASSDIEFIVEETDQVTRNFRQVTTQLQEGLMRSRMVPFAQIADRLPRAVRDISIKCGKQAELIVEGRDTLIDKMILEQLYDPMTHLVNNAITHGIETPDERRSVGKSEKGRILVRTFHQGNQTVIIVSDDGGGINPGFVKEKAIKKGLISAQEAQEMSDLDVYDLLFHAGFSTRDQADDFAGRGVGMDVVRTRLAEMRGVINVESSIGKGTSFTIRLPLTLSISKALSCVSNRARIAFPMDGVEDMLDVPKERIQTDDQGRSCILWRDTLLPFQPLADLLKYNRILGRGSVYGGSGDEEVISIIVLRSAGTHIALQVDQVLGEQEIVIKQLEGPVPKPLGVAGATVLGDGRIMPIADVLELIDLSMGRIRRDAGSSLWEQMAHPPVEEEETHADPTVLIVDDSITVRELLSMSFNKVGYRVEQARDGQEAWEKLRSGLPCDLVFCDIEMPRMDGLELLSRMQKDPALQKLPIAMLTSRGADRHRQMAVDLGASGYFTKPYLEEALLDAAKRMLKGEVLVGRKEAADSGA